MTQLNLLTQPKERDSATPISHVTAHKPSSSSILEFSTLVGQPIAVSLIQGAIALGRLAPAYLLAGPAGVGKTLFTRIFITQIFNTNNLTNYPDLLWVEPTHLHQGQLLNESEAAEHGLRRKASPQIRIEQIREITQFLALSPLVAPYKVVVIEDAHQMAQAAANALLKTLEEATGATIVLLSSQPQKLLPTIVSRCQVIPFHRLSNVEMETVLGQLGHQDILNNIVVMALAAGSPGAAIAHNDQLRSVPQSILGQLATPPTSPLAALRIAKEIEASLEFHQQLWLLDYLQHCWREQLSNSDWLWKLEEAKTALLKASPRLVWEVLLLPNS